MEAGISINYHGPLTKTEGKSVLSSFKSNKDLIYSHHKTKVHNTIVNYLKKKEEPKLLQGFQKAEKISSDKYCDTFEVTRTMFRLVYVEVKLNFPLFHHTELVKLLQMANVNMGFHHYECRSAQRIVDHITSEMCRGFIKGIKNFPCSRVNNN